MFAWIPALLRIGGYIIQYGPVVVDLVHKSMDLASKVQDPEQRADAAHDIVKAIGAPETQAALKAVVAKLK